MAFKQTPIAALAVAAVALAGCGGAAKPTHEARLVPREQVVNVTADPSGAFDFIPTFYDARPGRVTIELYNPLSAFGPEAIAIKGHGVHAVGPTARRNGVSRVTVTLRAGRYELYSPVDGHARLGMRAPLTVGPARERTGRG